MKPPEKDIYFIPRDGYVFQYVLEYLLYGQLLGFYSIEMLRKLEIDADFYLLPQLKEAVIEKRKRLQMENAAYQRGKPVVYCKLTGGHSDESYPYEDFSWYWKDVELSFPEASETFGFDREKQGQGLKTVVIKQVVPRSTMI